jgi:hypothetical protein
MLDAMVKFRVLDGIEHEQHYGFKPADVPPLTDRRPCRAGIRPVHPRPPTKVDFGPVASVPVDCGTV